MLPCRRGPCCDSLCCLSVDRRQLQKLSIVRLAEAKTLLRAKHWDGAYYLAGYSVECGLKACIAKQTRRFDFPDKKNVDASHTHDLKALVRIANLEPSRLQAAKSDPSFRDNWDLVQQWSEQSRYRRYEIADATALVKAVADAPHGVLRWIKQHW